jgi:hypothetical protein
MSAFLKPRYLFLWLSCSFWGFAATSVVGVGHSFAQDENLAQPSTRNRVDNVEASDILSRIPTWKLPIKNDEQGEQIEDESQLESLQKYFKSLPRIMRIKDSSKDLFFDEFLQIAIESPDDFGGWEITDNQAQQARQRIDSYRQFRKECLGKTEQLEDQEQIRDVMNQLALRRSGLSQSLVHHLLPAQIVSLVPMNTERYGLLSHATNGHMLGKWLKVTSKQQDKIRSESGDLCDEIENSLTNYRQKSADVFFKNLTKAQRQKFFTVFTPEKVKFAYGRLEFTTIHRHHDADMNFRSFEVRLPQSKVLVGDLHGQPERKEDQDSIKDSNFYRPEYRLSVKNPDESGASETTSKRKQLDLDSAKKHFFAPEFALITLDLMQRENGGEPDEQLTSGLKELRDRQSSLYGAWSLVDQFEGSEKWTTMQSKLREDYREILQDSIQFFSDERTAALLSSLEEMHVHSTCLVGWESFRDWLEITDEQFTRMVEDSRDLVADIEANLIDLRQKSADLFFNNLTRAQRDQFFEIFDQEKVSYFWGTLVHAHIFDQHDNTKGEAWFLWEEVPPPKDRPLRLQRFTEIKLPK